MTSYVKYPNFPVVKHPQVPIPQTQVIPARPPNVEHKSAPMYACSTFLVPSLLLTLFAFKYVVVATEITRSVVISWTVSKHRGVC